MIWERQARHTLPPTLSCLSPQINSHSSRALSCLKLHLWIIDHLLPQRPQCGIMRIKTRAEKAGREKCKRVKQRRWAETRLIPAPGQNPSKHLFCQGVRFLCWTITGFVCSWLILGRLVNEFVMKPAHAWMEAILTNWGEKSNGVVMNFQLPYNPLSTSRLICHVSISNNKKSAVF